MPFLGIFPYVMPGPPQMTTFEPENGAGITFLVVSAQLAQRCTTADSDQRLLALTFSIACRSPSRIGLWAAW